jgi:hypothetical protein
VWWSIPDPNAEASAKGIDPFEIASTWPNILQENPHAIMAQCVTQTELDQCAGVCLIPLEGPEHNTKHSVEGIKQFKIALVKYFTGMATCHRGTMCDPNRVRSVWWSMSDPNLISLNLL